MLLKILDLVMIQISTKVQSAVLQVMPHAFINA